MTRITFLPNVPEVLRSNSYHVSSHQKMTEVRTKRDHRSNKETRKMGFYDPSTEETEGVLSIIPGKPCIITKSCDTHAQAPQRNKQTQEERKKETEEECAKAFG